MGLVAFARAPGGKKDQNFANSLRRGVEGWEPFYLDSEIRVEVLVGVEGWEPFYLDSEIRVELLV